MRLQHVGSPFSDLPDTLGGSYYPGLVWVGVKDVTPGSATILGGIRHFSAASGFCKFSRFRGSGPSPTCAAAGEPRGGGGRLQRPGHKHPSRPAARSRADLAIMAAAGRGGRAVRRVRASSFPSPSAAAAEAAALAIAAGGRRLRGAGAVAVSTAQAHGSAAALR